MLELLQNKNKGYIILCNSGSFYIARGKDAVLLNKIIGLKVNCMETEICKVGFPLNSINKYTKLIEEKQYSYIVYNFDNSISKLKILKKYEGNKKNEIKEEKINCYICANTVKIYKKHDRYIQAVANLYEEEKELKNKEKEKENNILFQKIRRKLWRKKQKKKTN